MMEGVLFARSFNAGLSLDYQSNQSAAVCKTPGFFRRNEELIAALVSGKVCIKA